MPVYSKTKPKWQELVNLGWFLPDKSERPSKSITWLNEFARDNSDYIKIKWDDINWKEIKQNRYKLGLSIPVAIKRLDEVI